MIPANDIFAILQDYSRRGANADQLTYTYQNLRNGNKDFTPELEQKIQQIIYGIDTRERNLAAEIRSWIDEATGTFSIKDLHADLGITGRVAKKTASENLSRLTKQGLIERTGELRGLFRVVDQVCEKIQILAETSPGLDIRYPFEIEKLVKTYPKNIIVIAGEPNAGKTAFLLNFTFMNMFTNELHYFSSEMGPEEFSARIKKFELSPKTWEACNFWDRAGDFHDVIRPDAINVIDFLEIHEDFWKVGALLKKIYDRLDKGIAIIALQKNPQKKDRDGNTSNDLGLGGGRGLEKPRIYLTMGHRDGDHVIRIAKGKNWADELSNPNGLERTFKLAKGCVFMPLTAWALPEVSAKQGRK